MSAAEEMTRRAAEVKARLYGTPKINNIYREKRIEREEIDKLKEKLASKEKQIEELKAQIGVLQADLLCNAHMTLEMFRDANIDDEYKQNQSARAIIEATLKKSFPDVLFKEVVGKTRRDRVLEARKACMQAVFSERRDMSFPEIGRIFKKHHTTIMHAVGRKHAKRKENAAATDE